MGPRWILEIRNPRGCASEMAKNIHRTPYCTSSLVCFVTFAQLGILQFISKMLSLQSCEWQSTQKWEEYRKKELVPKKRQAEPITESEEDQLWEKGELEDHIPQTLLNTVVYMVGLYFVIRELLELRAETRCKNNYLYHYISFFLVKWLVLM